MSDGDHWTGAWCPQCGAAPSVDEDGMCNHCGAVAVGHGVEAALKRIAELTAERDEARLRARNAAAEAANLDALRRRCAEGLRCTADERDSALRRVAKLDTALGRLRTGLQCALDLPSDATDEDILCAVARLRDAEVDT